MDTPQIHVSFAVFYFESELKRQLICLGYALYEAQTILLADLHKLWNAKPYAFM